MVERLLPKQDVASSKSRFPLQSKETAWNIPGRLFALTAFLTEFTVYSQAALRGRNASHGMLFAVPQGGMSANFNRRQATDESETDTDRIGDRARSVHRVGSLPADPCSGAE